MKINEVSFQFKILDTHKQNKPKELKEWRRLKAENNTIEENLFGKSKWKRANTKTKLWQIWFKIKRTKSKYVKKIKRNRWLHKSFFKP